MIRNRKFHSTSARIVGVFLLLMATVSFAQNYTAEKTTDHGVPIVRLSDAANGVVVSIVPSVGNRAYEMKVHGQNILWFPTDDVSEYVKHPELGGIPLLAPWADLLDEQAFWANGKRYGFNMALGNVRGIMPSHGFVVNSPLWEVTDVTADSQSAHVTSRLEFWKSPDYMAQWPFAQEYEMTYSLSGGILEVKTTISNLSMDPMPISIGYHSFYQIPGVPRDQWSAHIPARMHVAADEHKISTGEMKPTDLPDLLPLGGSSLPDGFTSADAWRSVEGFAAKNPGITFDDGFTDLERDADGRAHFWIESGGKKVEVMFGPNYPVATIWLPPGRPFIAFESLTAIIDGLNLARQGKYSALQILPPGGKWTDSFWIRASGI
ncbi:MAG TPA: aldose 1-epimerase [Puia sp.]|nr:aldose 1-epimerase [Puia sp.]